MAKRLSWVNPPPDEHAVGVLDVRVVLLAVAGDRHARVRPILYGSGGQLVLGDEVVIGLRARPRHVDVQLVELSRRPRIDPQSHRGGNLGGLLGGAVVGGAPIIRCGAAADPRTLDAVDPLGGDEEVVDVLLLARVALHHHEVWVVLQAGAFFEAVLTFCPEGLLTVGIAAIIFVGVWAACRRRRGERVPGAGENARACEYGGARHTGELDEPAPRQLARLVVFMHDYPRQPASVAICRDLRAPCGSGRTRDRKRRRQ